MSRPPVGRAAAVSLAFVLASATPANAQAAAATTTTVAATTPATPDSVRVDLARRVLDLQQTGPVIVRELEASLEVQRRANPKIPEIFWTEFADRARRDMPRFVEALAPLYAARFTREELVELLAFYESPIGRRLAAESETLSAAMKQEAYRWGVTLGADVAKDLAERGIMLQ
jgi:hypothetical protein